jgi:hypothetical protein
LYQGYVNITGLTLILHPYVKSKLWEDVSFNAVKMALFRIGKNIVMPKKINIFKTKEIFIKKWINILTTNLEKFDWKIIKKVKWKYISSINWKTQKTLIFDDYYKEQAKKLFEIKEISEKEIISDLIIVWIKINEDWEENIQNIKWVFYLISKNLYFYWVNILQVIQTKNEFSVVVEEKYLKDAVYSISSI